MHAKVSTSQTFLGFLITGVDSNNTLVGLYSVGRCRFSHVVARKV